MGLVGSAVARSEDRALLTGAAPYAGDLQLEGLCHAVIVRATVAHARIRGIETAAAARAPGVRGVFTAEDLQLAPVPLWPMTASADEQWHRPVIARDTVRFVGEMVALVCADSIAEAIDAAELVCVDYDPLPVVVDLVAAADAAARPLFPTKGSNTVVDIPFEGGSPGAGASTSVSLRFLSPRLAVAPMETNAVTVVPEDDGRLTVWPSTQYPHLLRDFIARTLGRASAEVHVICPAVGGGFGGKSPLEVEYPLVAAAAAVLRRPVRYVETRTENLATMHGRGHVFNVRLAATADGVLTDLDVDMVTDAGAYPALGCGMPMTARSLAAGPYRVPHVSFRIRCVATNTAPTGAFRGAGRPEATACLDRTLDVLAADLGIDPVEIRRRNLIAADAFPYTTPTGVDYDSGEYVQALDTALELVGYESWRGEQARRRAANDDALLGIGVCCYVELSAGAPGMGDEFGSVRVKRDGTVQVLAGTSAHGQGHATVFAQIVSDVLGVPFEHIAFTDGDTDVVPTGKGTAGSRSVQTAGSAVKVAAEAVLEQACTLAASELEAAVGDIVVVPGAGLAVAGVPSTAVSWARLAALAEAADGADLSAAPGFSQQGGTAPFGCHIAVVEIDRETGAVRVERLVAVDDCGIVINPALAEGQVHGGVVAGIGEALFEEVRYDVDGNLLTAVFADYAMPSAADLPAIESAFTCTPSPKNPLGAKGLGEAGTCGALTAVHNAVVDAVAHFGIRHIDRPLTPERVWAAMETAGDR